MGGPSSPSSPRRHAGVFTSRLQGTDSEKGVWFCGHGSFNQKTDRSPKYYKIPTWLKGGVYFWCHDKQTLKAVLSEAIIDNPSVAAIQGLIKAKFGERYRDHNFDNLPVHY